MKNLSDRGIRRTSIEIVSLPCIYVICLPLWCDSRFVKETPSEGKRRRKKRCPVLSSGLPTKGCPVSSPFVLSILTCLWWCTHLPRLVSTQYSIRGHCGCSLSLRPLSVPTDGVVRTPDVTLHPHSVIVVIP